MGGISSYESHLYTVIGMQYWYMLMTKMNVYVHWPNRTIIRSCIVASRKLYPYDVRRGLINVCVC